MGGWPRYLRLTRREPVLALWLHEAPRDVLDVLRKAATRHFLRTFPGYGAIRDEIHVRVADVPLQDSLPRPRSKRRNTSHIVIAATPPRFRNH